MDASKLEYVMAAGQKSALKIPQQMLNGSPICMSGLRNIQVLPKFTAEEEQEESTEDVSTADEDSEEEQLLE